MLNKNTIEYLIAGKYISEKMPMIHQKRRLDSFVLLYGVKGTLYISDGGREYEVSPNEYLILAADREHVGTKYSPPGLSYYWCHFYLNCDYKLTVDDGKNEYLELDDGNGFRIAMHGEFAEASKIHLLFHQLIDSSLTVSEHSIFIANSFLGIILAEIASVGAREGKKNNSMLTENVLQWIRLSASQISGVRDIADNFGYNSEYLTTMIKKHTGKTLTEHINENRILKACELLRSTDKSVKEIAFESGYSDEKYFLRVFKKYRDITPKEYRNVYAKQNNNDK